jgi:hypothetical protein
MLFKSLVSILYQERFKRVCTVAKSAVRLSACVRAAATAQIVVTFDTTHLIKKICPETPDVVKILQKYRAVYIKT